MTSDQFARDYLNRARTRRIAVGALMAAGGYPDVVRESQDLVELVLKGALRFVGVDPPKRHDVHGVDLDRLAGERSPAFYGNEAEGVPASELFGEEDARRAMVIADRLLDLYARLLGEAS